MIKTSAHLTRSWIQRIGRVLLLLVPFLLLWWTFRQVSFDQVWGIFHQVNILQLTIWLLSNVGLVIMMTGRWWLILKSLGHPLPYLSLTRYRLGSFAVSYFTPGPHFGGEPVQVLALRQFHGIPGTTGTASVALDKLLELIINFSFLAFGTTIALTNTWLSVEWRKLGLAFAIGMLAIPLAYLVLILSGKKTIQLANRSPSPNNGPKLDHKDAAQCGKRDVRFLCGLSPNRIYGSCGIGHRLVLYGL